MINKQEIKYISFAGLFAFVFFTLIIPFFLNRGIEKSSPFIQFFIFNIVIFIFLQIYLKAKVLSIGVKLRKTFEMMLVFMAIDTWIPPFLITQQGKLLSGIILSASASDYLWGYIALSIGLKGILVYFFTYLFVPMLLLIGASMLNGNFVRRM